MPPRPAKSRVSRACSWRPCIVSSNSSSSSALAANVAQPPRALLAQPLRLRSRGQRAIEHRLGARIRERDDVVGIERDDAARDVAQNRVGAALRGFERRAALAEVGGHSPEGGEHRLEFVGRARGERRLAIAARDRERRHAQRPDRLGERARGDAAQAERGQRAEHRGAGNEHGEIVASLVEHRLRSARRRADHVGLAGPARRHAKSEQRRSLVRPPP